MTFSWKDFENNVVKIKLNFLKKFFVKTPEKGKAFLYRILELIRGMEDDKINLARLAYTLARLEEALKKDVVMTQLKLLRFRKNFPAFEKMNNIKIQAVGSTICFTWENEGYIARLNADFRTCEFKVEGIDPQGDTVFNLEN